MVIIIGYFNLIYKICYYKLIQVSLSINLNLCHLVKRIRTTRILYLLSFETDPVSHNVSLN